MFSVCPRRTAPRAPIIGGTCGRFEEVPDHLWVQEFAKCCFLATLRGRMTTDGRCRHCMDRHYHADVLIVDLHRRLAARPACSLVENHIGLAAQRVLGVARTGCVEDRSMSAGPGEFTTTVWLFPGFLLTELLSCDSIPVPMFVLVGQFREHGRSFNGCFYDSLVTK